MSLDIAPLTSALALESGGNLATIKTNTTGAALDGTDGTGITQPTGGVGIRGWLSGIYSTLLSILTGVNNPIPAGTAVIGSILSLRTPASTNSQASNTSIAASVPAVASQYSYLSGLMISGLGATAAGVVACNITNILASGGGSNTWNFSINVPSGVTVPFNNGLPLVINFDPPLQSKAVNTALQVNVGAFGTGNTQQVVSAWGYNSASALYSL